MVAKTHGHAIKQERGYQTYAALIEAGFRSKDEFLDALEEWHLQQVLGSALDKHEEAPIRFAFQLGQKLYVGEMQRAFVLVSDIDTRLAEAQARITRPAGSVSGDGSTTTAKRRSAARR